MNSTQLPSIFKLFRFPYHILAQVLELGDLALLYHTASRPVLGKPSVLLNWYRVGFPKTKWSLTCTRLMEPLPPHLLLQYAISLFIHVRLRRPKRLFPFGFPINIP